MKPIFPLLFNSLFPAVPLRSPLFAILIISISFFLHLPQLSYGAPILPPDLTRCSMASVSSVVGPPLTLTFNCCIPLPPKQTVQFSFEKYPAVPRIRRPAQNASQAYINKYNKAYELMKNLPADDPRSFAAQANVHCAFCQGAYKQRGNNVTLQVHFSWLFLPWHRWYLYFHERILAKLIDDPTFSLLFWNWDNQEDGNVMPAMFVQNGMAVYDAKRNQDHLPPTLVVLNVLSNTTDRNAIIQENLNQMYQGVVTASTAELFEGGVYRQGTDDSNSTVLDAPLGGSIENGIHNAVHFWTGDPNQPLLEDMGNFATASRDPIFYAHHSNVDRLWDVWKTLPGGRRTDHSDPDFLNAEFLFYDENAELVTVKVRDALDNKKLGVSYQKVEADQLWINYEPQATTNGTTNTSSSSIIDIEQTSSLSESIELGETFSAVVKMPGEPSKELLKAKGVKKVSDLEKVLVIKGVELSRTTFLNLVVFVNLPDANQRTRIDSAEYVGTFSSLPSPKPLTTDVKLEIGDNLRRIGLDKAPSVIITIVKASSPSTVLVKIKGMTIEYE